MIRQLTTKRDMEHNAYNKTGWSTAGKLYYADVALAAVNTQTVPRHTENVALANWFNQTDKLEPEVIRVVGDSSGVGL